MSHLKKMIFYSLLLHVPLLAFNNSLTPSFFLSLRILFLSICYYSFVLCNPFFLFTFSSFQFPHFIRLRVNLANIFTSREATERSKGPRYGYFLVYIETNNRRLQTKINTHMRKMRLAFIIKTKTINHDSEASKNKINYFQMTLTDVATTHTARKGTK